MFYVKSRVLGADGLGPIDPDRRDRLPGDKWRLVPRNPYWQRLAGMGDVLLQEEAPAAPEIEGYEPPATGDAPADDAA